MALSIRAETARDFERIRQINEAAFESPAEADLVEALRQSAEPIISLVAETSSGVQGHILFSPVTIDDADILCFGLGPMAVEPAGQRSGIGSLLVTAGLASCRDLGASAVVVLGHPGFYPRFGFSPASRFGISPEFDVPDEVFMAQELANGGLDGVEGVARYHPAFAAA